MKNLKEREEVIEYSIKLNTTNLSPLRSGNISVRGIEDDISVSYTHLTLPTIDLV